MVKSTIVCEASSLTLHWTWRTSGLVFNNNSVLQLMQITRLLHTKMWTHTRKLGTQWTSSKYFFFSCTIVSHQILTSPSFIAIASTVADVHDLTHTLRSKSTFSHIYSCHIVPTLPVHGHKRYFHIRVVTYYLIQDFHYFPGCNWFIGLLHKLNYLHIYIKYHK